MPHKQAFNLVNPQSVADYLDRFAPDEKLGLLLRTALEKPLKSHERNLRLVENLPESAPEWLVKKWNDSVFHEFMPDPSLDEKVHHIKDWIKGALSRDEAWLKNADEKGRPRKLLKIGSLEQAVKEADKDMQRQRQRLIHIGGVALEEHDEILSGDVVHVMVFPDGYRIVQLLTKGALDRETTYMGHCIGNGGYDDYLPSVGGDARYIYYSLRDKDNRPHVTLEVDFIDRKLYQCKGKQNVAPAEKYLSHVKGFLKRANITFGHYMENLGMVFHDGELYDVRSLPDMFTFSGNLDITRFEHFNFPGSLAIKGNLVLRQDQVKSMPSCLTISGRQEEKYYEGNLHYRTIARRGKNGIIREECWYNTDGLHRDGAPAVIHYAAEDGKATRELWYRNAKLHRDDGPAVVNRDVITGKIISESFWIDGKPYVQKAG